MPSRPAESRPDLYKMTNLGSGYKNIHKLPVPSRNEESPSFVTRTNKRMTFDQPIKYGNDRSKSQNDF